MSTRRWLCGLSAALLLLGGCASHPSSARIKRVVVASYKAADDKDTGKLVSEALHGADIDMVGIGNGGGVDVSVPKDQAAKARRVLSELKTREGALNIH